MHPLRHSLHNTKTARRLFLIIAISLIALIFAAGVGATLRAALFQDSDVAVNKTGPATAAADTDITYTITMSNVGPEDLVNAQMIDSIPSQTTFVSITPISDCNYDGMSNQVTCSQAVLATGASQDYTLTVHIANDAAPGSFITNVAHVSANNDTNEENNSSAASTQIPSNSNEADLSITKNGPPLTHPNADLSYTITVTNPGPNTATNVQLTDTLPSGITFVSFNQTSGPTWDDCNVTSSPAICKTSSLPPGTSTFTLVGHVPGAANGTQYDNHVFITSDADPNSENNEGATGTTVSSCFNDQVVVNNADNGTGSLRQAIIDACANSTITFDTSQDISPIVLTTGELTIDKNLTIQGPSANLLTISGNDTSRVFHINPGETAVISGLTISNGNVTNNSYPDVRGGAILNDHGTLTLSDCVVTNNQALGAFGAAGAIYNNSESGAPATLTITNSILSSNFSGAGGAIYNNGNVGGVATLTINTSTLSGNNASGVAGAIYNTGSGANGASGMATLNVNSTTISGNIASSFGSGIYNVCQTVGSDTGTCLVNIKNSTISRNTAGNSSGGAIFNSSESSATATMTISNSTVSGNTAGTGGGIYNSAATVSLTSTIVSDNTGTLGAPDISNNNGGDISGSYNLVQSTNGYSFSSGTNNLFNKDPFLQKANDGKPLLQNNGGPTMTIGLTSASPVIDAGSNPGSLASDQRGLSREVDGPDADTTATADIGAFEAQVSVEDITDKVTNEDTPLQFSFNVGGLASVTATSSQPGLAPNPTISGSGSTRTITINPVANQFGSATITVNVFDNGGQSMTDTFGLIVNPVGDQPSVTNASTTVNTQSTSGLVISRNAVDGAEITHFKITSISNGTLFKNDGTTQINDGDFITFDEGNAGLKFTPALNSTSAGSFNVQSAPGTDGNGLGIAASAVITVNCGPTIVTNSNNSGAGSLRSTINTACPGATITFDMSAGHVTSPITLTTGELLINKNLTITGPGANLLTISGNNASRVFEITSGQTVILTGLTLTKGKVSSVGINQGGAILNAGSLTLTNITTSGNTTISLSPAGTNAGGGIFNAASGTMVMTGNTLTSNGALQGTSSQGGAIANLGTLTITNSTFLSNQATGASASNKGGGIYNEGTLTVNNTSLSQNVIGGDGSDEGGGLFNSGNATITNSLLLANLVTGSATTGAGGGVRSVSNKLVIVNSTITNNQVFNNNSNSGGGIDNGGSSTLVLVSSTVAFNTVAGSGSIAGGVSTTGPTNLRNNIIANNIAAASPDVFGTFNSLGHNLIQNTTGSNGFGSNADILGADPLLQTIADNGGTTQTIGLKAGSPALDAGDNCVTDPTHCFDPDIPQLTFDQRGTPFARSVDGPDANTAATVDIGAFEAWVSVEDIPDKTINEDSQLQFTFNIGGGANVTNVLVVSQNPTLVPNNPANLALSGSGSTRTLTINPAANLFGTAIISVNVAGTNNQSLSDTFVLTVNPVADTPSVTNASTSVNTQTTSGLVISRSPADNAEVTHFKITNISGGTLFKNNGTTQINSNDFITFAEGNAGLKFTPALNSNANGSFQVQASINNNNTGLGGGLAMASISVNCGSTVVINSNDSGPGSLRNAILQACVGTTITFDLTPGKVTNPVTLTSGELLFDKNLTIQGPNANVLTIQRSPAAGTPLFRILNIPAGVSLSVSGLTLSNADNASNGGAIRNDGTLTLNSMTLSNNHTAAGGSVLLNGPGAIATVSNSTFSNNKADVWAAIYNVGSALTLTNSTLTANINQGSNPGAAVFAESFSGVTNITNCTISQNTSTGGEAVFRNPGGTAQVNLKNTIVSGNPGGDVNGTTDNGNNLIGGNALLAALANYGGPTQTMALLPGSPAINAGTATGAPTTDQRGLSRVGAVDIGAFESRGFTMSATSGTPQSATILTAFANPLVISIGGVGGEPVDGGIVTFTAPSANASAVLNGGNSTANINIAGGQASANASANGITGAYNVIASANGSTSASFSLTNNKAATTTTVTSSVNPSDLNQSVTFTATVSGAVTPTGSVQFKDNGANLGSPVALNGSGVATLTTSALTLGNHTITADYSGDGNLLASTGTLTGGQTVRLRPLIKFSQPTYSVNENGNVISITVTRQGDTSLPVTVDYATPDDSAAMSVLPCSTTNGVASPRCDFTTTIGTLRFAAGETSKTFNVLISQDVWLEGNETAQLTLSNPTGGAAFQQASDAIAVLTIVDDDTSSPSTNAIDDSGTFVRQQYHDFLNREPDQAGFNFWVNQIESCGADSQCREIKRINVSAAFFLSIEFQNTGYFVERMYKAGYGDIAPPTVPVPVRFTNFIRDTQQIRGDVIVGVGDWQTQLDNNKKAFALDFVQRSTFLDRYPVITSATAFVDALNANAGMVLTDSERSALIAQLTPNASSPALRADVLTKVAENALLQQREFNRAFVLMQYFGYLRRNPDAAPEASLNFDGFNFWLGKLNQFNGNYVGAEMIKAFINSKEYRGRFGP